MSIATIEKTMGQLPAAKLTSLLEDLIRRLLSPKRRQTLFLRFVGEIEELNDNPACPIKIQHREPNAETRRALEETEPWVALKRKLEKAKTGRERTTLQKELTALEKKIGLVRCKDLDDFRRRFKLPTKKEV